MKIASGKTYGIASSLSRFILRGKRRGSRVICEQRDLLYEESPAAYKNIEDVVQELVDAELASVIATFRPLLTYKTRALRR